MILERNFNMKIRVIVPFRDVAFNDQITRNVGDIIDTTNPEFKCSEDLARERIRRGFCVEVKDDDPKIEEIIKVGDNVIGFGPVEVIEKPKKGKKANKKK